MCDAAAQSKGAVPQLQVEKQKARMPAMSSIEALAAHLKVTSDRVPELINSLKDARDRWILRVRYGIRRDAMSVEEGARTLEVSRAVFRIIESGALKHLEKLARGA